MGRSSFLVLLFVSVVIAKNNPICPNQQSLEESLRKVYIPGAVIIVVNATDVLYEQAFGYQSLSSKIPMNTNNSIFTLASLSKTFIGVAVMQLVEKNLLELDTDINQYLSEPNRSIIHPHYPSHSITLRRLLSHSASIYENIQSLTNFILPGDTAFTSPTALTDLSLPYVHRNASYWLPKPPGTVTFYSNDGSSLAALIVEKIAKIPYHEYVKEYILKPLHIDIHKAGFRLADFENNDKLVESYVYATNDTFLSLWNQELPQFNITPIPVPNSFPTWLHIPFYSIRPYPSGLLRMSAHSLSLFLRMIIQNGSSLLSPASVTEMRRVVGDGLIPYYVENSTSNSTEQDQMTKYGVGWLWYPLKNGHRYFGHSGGLPGMSHFMLINEKNTIGVIVLSNGDILQPIDLSKDVFLTILDLQMQLFQCFDNYN